MEDQITPYFNSSDCLVIPCNSDPKYHYWNGGQPLSDTRLELNVSETLWDKYILKPYPGKIV